MSKIGFACYLYLFCDIFHRITSLDFGEIFWKNSPPPSTIHDFLSQILCERQNDELFYENKFVVGKKCDDCGNLTEFQNKYHTDINDQ